MVCWLVLCLAPQSLAQGHNIRFFSSSIVATCSTAGTSGSSPSLASCTSLLWVRIQLLPEQRFRSRSTLATYSNGDTFAIVCRVPLHSSIHLDIAFTQRSPHAHDRCPTRPAWQERSGSDWVSGWDQWIVQDNCHHAHRVFRPLRGELVVGNRSDGCRQPSHKYTLSYPR